jgi:hypothetical protein
MPLPKDATTFRAVIDGYVVTCDKSRDEIKFGDDCYVVHTREGAEVERGLTWGEVAEVIRLHAAQRDARRPATAR